MTASRARPTTEPDAVILIPRDTAGGSRKARVERAVRWLWSRGIYPGPAAVSLRLHGRANRTINGFETSIRNRMLSELGISRQRRYPPGYPWSPTESVLGSWANR